MGDQELGRKNPARYRESCGSFLDFTTVGWDIEILISSPKIQHLKKLGS